MDPLVDTWPTNCRGRDVYEQAILPLEVKKMTPHVEVFFHGNYRGGSYFKTSLGSVIFLL